MMVDVDHDCGVGGGMCPECIVTHHLHQALDVASRVAVEAHGRRLIRRHEGKPPCVAAFDRVKVFLGESASPEASYMVRGVPEREIGAEKKLTQRNELGDRCHRVGV